MLDIAERLGRGQARPVEKRVACHQIAVHVAVGGDLRDVERSS